MTQNHLNEEQYELLKDQNITQTEDSEFFFLETQLTAYQNSTPSANLSKKILNHTKQSIQLFVPQKFLLTVAVLCLFFGAFLLFSEQKKIVVSETKYQNVQTNNEFNLNNILGIELPQKHKYYAIYISSAVCKPCVDLLSELDQFYVEQKSKNADFELVFVELNKYTYTLGKNNFTHFKKIEFKDLKNKAALAKYREGQGPALVMIDNQGNIVAKHQKNAHQNSFAPILTQISDLLSKS